MSASTLVDPRAPRFAAAASSVVLVGALLADGTAQAWLLIGQAAVFALGAVGWSPYAVLFRHVARPHLRPPAELEDSRPVAFAQTVGLAFVLVALAGSAVALPAATFIAAAAALAAAFLNAVFGICLGCEAYLLLRRSPISRYVPTTTPHRTPTEASA